jgi:hypothetical protein
LHTQSIVMFTFLDQRRPILSCLMKDVYMAVESVTKAKMPSFISRGVVFFV